MPPLTDADLLADLTPAQKEAVTHINGPLLVLAGAGSGKTRVITRRVAYLLLHGIPPGNILAITFTNKAAGEMKQRVEALLPGSRIWISTFHALGAKLLRMYADRLDLDRNFTIYDQTDRAKVVKLAMEDAGIDEGRFNADTISGAISKAKNQLLSPQKYAEKAHDYFTQTVAKIYPAYEARLKQSSALDFDDLLYWPALAMKNDQQLRAELDARFRYVLIDEYQDTNQAQYAIARSLTVDYDNICCVGDPDQCLLPGTLVDTPDGPMPIEQLQEGDLVTSSIGWGKTTPRPIDKVLINPHRGKILRITVEGGRAFRATPNHMCFARLEADPERHFVYLMWKRGVGYRLGTTRGVRASKDGAIMSGIQVRTNQEVSDAVWIVKTCATSSEARFYEQLLSVRYGIPTMVFFVRGRNMGISQSLIDQLYQEIDTESAARRLMSDFHLDHRFPHHRPGAVVRGGLTRRHLYFTQFGDGRPRETGRWHEHRVQLVTSGLELREKARRANLPVREGNRGTWRIETSRRDYSDAMELAESITQLDELEIVSRARLTSGKAFPFTPASHLHPGMIVPVCEGDQVKEARILSVEWEDYDGPVYDLSVPQTHNFGANGVIVHNSIYKWRGSDIRNILDFERDYPNAKVLTLSTNYRSTKNILHAASGLIAHNKQRKDKDLVTDNPPGDPVTIITYETGQHEAAGIAAAIQKLVKSGKRAYRDCAVFMRVNALSRTLELEFTKARVPFQIVKGLAFFERKENKDVLAYLRLLLNPRDDVSFLRIINEPARGIGKISLEHLSRYAEEKEIPLLEAAADINKITLIKGKAATGLRDFSLIFAQLRQSLESPPEEIIRQVLDKSGYRAMLQNSKDEDDADRLANIEELITAAREFTREDPTRTLSDFLENITLASDVDGWNEKQDCVSIMTMHAAKGLEFPVVFVTALEQGLLPHERSLGKTEDIEEERRLAFVALTRAKEQLFVSCARLREFRGSTLYTIPSMFLSELPREAICEIDGGAPGISAADRYREAGTPAARQGWNEASVKPVPLPIPTRQKEGTQDYVVGMIVRHATYGEGTITEVTGNGVLRKIKVRFRRHGERAFIADKVTLEIVHRP